MALRLRRGPDQDRYTKVFAEGEIVYTTDTKRIYIGDGETLGGIDVTGINNLLEDISPQLGGHLDLNNYDIVGSGNISILGNLNVGGELTIPAIATNVTGSVYADESTILVDGESGTLNLQYNSIFDLVDVYTAAEIQNGQILKWVDDHFELSTLSIDDGNLLGDVRGNVLAVDGSTIILDHVAAKLYGDVDGNLNGDVTGDLLGNVTGDVTGDVTGHVVGTLTGNVLAADGSTTLLNATLGILYGDVTGNVTGDLVGDVIGNVTGDLNGNVVGDVTGDLLGDVTGNVTGTVIGGLIGTVYAADGSTVLLDDNGLNISQISITQLADVDNFTAPLNGQVLSWSSVDQKWVTTDADTLFTTDLIQSTFKGSLYGLDSELIIDADNSALTVDFANINTAVSAKSLEIKNDAGIAYQQIIRKQNTPRTGNFDFLSKLQFTHEDNVDNLVVNEITSTTKGFIIFTGGEIAAGQGFLDGQGNVDQTRVFTVQSQGIGIGVFDATCSVDAAGAIKVGSDADPATNITSPGAGMIIFNSTTHKFQGYTDDITGSGGGPGWVDLH